MGKGELVFLKKNKEERRIGEFKAHKIYSRQKRDEGAIDLLKMFVWTDGEIEKKSMVNVANLQDRIKIGCWEEHEITLQK